MDSVTVDLGFIQNAGFTYKQATHKESDDQFALQVEIQMADHPALSNGTIQEVFIAVKFGDTIVVGKCKYTSYISFLGATK